MNLRPCRVEISIPHLKENFRFLQSLAAPHAELLAIVKANAYGHSLALCAPAVVSAGARWLGVTSVEEGIAARAVCPEAHILIIGGLFPGQGQQVIEHNLTVVVWEQWQLGELEAAARQLHRPPASVPVHLEIDTGMSRQGVGAESLHAVLARFAPGSALHLEAVMTHLFAADEADGDVTALQLERLDRALEAIGASGMLPDWLNVGNSAALVAGQAERIAALAAQHGMKTMIRPGLALYGLIPDFDPPFAGEEPSALIAARERLKPVLSWKTQVTGVRDIPAGAVVGYNGTFVASEPMRVALIAAGYADGLDRQLGNRFSLLVRGQHAPLAGRVSMDQAVLDVTGIPGVAPGDEVVLIGRQLEHEITARDHARTAQTIPWEVFTRIGERVPRFAV